MSKEAHASEATEIIIEDGLMWRNQWTLYLDQCIYTYREHTHTYTHWMSVLGIQLFIILSVTV